jgi:intracellular sulfur oxidation DsrE/DsrF family protein
MNKPMLARAAMIGAIALLVTSDAAAARTQLARHHASTRGHHAVKADLALAAPEKSQARAVKKEHHLILQVNSNDPAAMNLALNNATNVTQYYQQTGEPVKIEVVAFGPGLHMLREDTSPVKARIETMSLSNPEISFKACGNTRDNMHKTESKDIAIIPQAEVVTSGVVHIMELEEQGWTYVKP